MVGKDCFFTNMINPRSHKTPQWSLNLAKRFYAEQDACGVLKCLPLAHLLGGQGKRYQVNCKVKKYHRGASLIGGRWTHAVPDIRP